MLPIIILIAIAAIGIPIYLKRKKGKTTAISISNRKNKDEVWKTIKQYLKDSNDFGKEIIDCYVAKRNSIDYINPNLPRYLKDKKRAEVKIRKWQFQQEKLLAKKNHKKVFAPKERDLYVVCFTTKQIKNGVVDQPRAIECEVVNTRVNKKEWDRKILINQLLNYDQEMEWIAPLKYNEQQKNKKTIKQQQIESKRKEKRESKIKQKNKNKIEKAKSKALKKQEKNKKHVK
ncbi:MAG: DUF5385 family protein [Mycoplasmataceae bacterium]|nr:DUF5385 family protein [Mycoplasmataceae bacterium]